MLQAALNPGWPKVVPARDSRCGSGQEAADAVWILRACRSGSFWNSSPAPFWPTNFSEIVH